MVVWQKQIACEVYVPYKVKIYIIDAMIIVQGCVKSYG